MEKPHRTLKTMAWTGGLAALAAVAVLALLVNIFERKQEARNPF